MIYVYCQVKILTLSGEVMFITRIFT